MNDDVDDVDGCCWWEEGERERDWRNFCWRWGEVERERKSLLEKSAEVEGKVVRWRIVWLWRRLWRALERDFSRWVIAGGMGLLSGIFFYFLFLVCFVSRYECDVNIW